MPAKTKNLGKSVTDPLELPRDVAKRLKRCTDKNLGRGIASDPVKYLWLYATECCAGRKQTRQMGLEDWLNVVDESASLGVCCMMACVRTPLTRHPDVWRVCQWAQDTHDMMVGLYIYDGALEDADLAVLKKLDLRKTCLFVDEAASTSMDLLSKKGFRAFPASIPHEHKGDSCDIPGSMVCVSSEGTLYTCGVVLGDERFRLGTVFEKPLRSIVTDERLPHAVPHEVSHETGRSCVPCPPLLVKHTLGALQ